MNKYFILVLLIAFTNRMYASGDSTSMTHFTVDNGLPSNNVYAVVQDQLGYIWFNTDNGVVKYNGYSFKVFSISDGLPSNDIWKLYPDQRGRLWVLTHAYKIGYIKNDKYKVLISSTEKSIHPININSDRNNVYFFYKDHNLTKLVTVDSNDRISILPIDTPGSKTILCTMSRDNVLLLANAENVIYTKNLSKNSKTFDSLKIGFPLSALTANSGLIQYYKGRIFGTAAYLDNFALVDNNGMKYKRIFFYQLGGQKDEHTYIYYDDNDSLTLITNKGIYLVDYYFKGYRRISSANVLPSAFQIAYYNVDKFHNTWYTTTNEGAWCVHVNTGMFKASSKLSILNNTKRIGALQNGNTYWVNKKQNVVYELDKESHIKTIKPPHNDLPAIITDKNDSELYFGTNKTLYIYHVRQKKFVNVVDYFSIDTLKRLNQNFEPPITTGYKFRSTTFMTLAGLYPIGENKWLAYYLYPVLKTIEIKANTAKTYTLDLERYNNIWFDSADNKYFFTSLNRIAVFNPVNNKYNVFDSHLLSKLHISSIQGITSDKFSNIYILDNDRIDVFNTKTFAFGTIKCNFHLTGAYIYAYKDIFIIAGKFGLAFAHIAGPVSVSIFKVAINTNSYNRIYDIIVNNAAHIYMSTDKGFIDIVIKDLLNSQQLSDLAASGFFNLIVSAPEQKRLLNGDTIFVQQNAIKIDLDLINFFGKGKLKYLYKIDGYNADWQQTTGEVYIGNIKVNHFYRVRCIVEDNTWVSKEYIFYIYKSSYKIIVFWISSILAFAGFILIVVLLTRYIVARSNEKKRVLTELELRAVYAQINPHFIFNTLSAALYFINRKRFDDAYVHVSKFSRLIRGYLKSSQDRYISLSDEIEMLRNYIELQKTRFEGQFEYKLIVDNKLSIQNIKIPSLLLQPLVENAINHGLFHKKEGGELLIIFEKGAHNDELICIIDDNGIGRERAKEIKRKSAIERESYGTKLTKQLIDVFKEFESINILIEYIDKQLPETGTIVKLTIKNIKYVA